KTQSDRPKGIKSGLIEAETRLQSVKGLSIQYLEQAEVVRHPLVGRIISRYEEEA
ncbi:phosphate starvation-inducible protein PhoH, partial [Staphylococcus equorum]